MHNALVRALAALLVLLAGCMGQVSEGDAPIERPYQDVHDVSTRCPGNRVPPPAEGLRLRSVALYQTVRIELLREGKKPFDRPAPIVQGKKALVRAFVDTLPGYERHPVRAVLTLRDRKGVTVIKASERTLEGSSVEEEADSTFTFALDGAAIGKDTTWEVALYEVECDAAGGDPNVTRFPKEGDAKAALSAKAIGPMHVVVVPVRIGDRSPVLGGAELEKLRETLLAYYPVPDVELRLHAEVLGPKSVPVEGLSSIVSTMAKLRSRERARREEYYIGLVRPTDARDEHCGEQTCVIGEALTPVRAEEGGGGQAGAALYWNDAKSRETVVHEIGHMHGLPHAPCGPVAASTVDPRFPFAGGAIGDEGTGFGWDSRSGELVPVTHKDVMGYCERNWISPYNYKELAVRSSEIHSLKLALGGRPHRELFLYGDGRAAWGEGEPRLDAGKPEPAEVLDAAGGVLAHITVYRIPFAHEAGGLLYLPTPEPGWSSVVLSDRTLELGAIEPPP